MDLVRGFLNLWTALIGGTLFVIFSIAAVLCSLAALLALSDENRIAFNMIAKSASFGLIGFGLFLPLRSVSIFGSLLALFWAAFLAEVVPQFRIYQFAVASVISVFFWVRHLATTESILPLTIGDFTIFVLVPIVFGLVQLSRGAQTLSKQDSGPKIPLHKFLSLLKDILESVFPVSK